MMSDDKILNEYAKIDKINPYPSNHGIKHIKNVLQLVDKIIPLFDLSNREVLILKTCVVFHDIGQVEGRKNHGTRSADFAMSYLKDKQIFSKKELEKIYNDIKYHDEFINYDKLIDMVSWLVNLIDKFDFSRHRLESNYKDNYSYSAYEDIDSIEFEKNENLIIVRIVVIDKPKIISEDELFKKNLFSKAVQILTKFCDYFKLESEIYLGNQKLNLNKINKKVIVDKDIYERK